MNSNQKNISRTALLQHASPVTDVHPHLQLVVEGAHTVWTVGVAADIERED
jgi:hypothetical protein